MDGGVWFLLQEVWANESVGNKNKKSLKGFPIRPLSFTSIRFFNF